MRVQLFAVFIVCVQAISLNATTDWSALVKDLSKSVVPVGRNDGGIQCSGFVINSRVRKKDETKSYVATAAHCKAAEMWAKGARVEEIVHQDDNKDLMVVMTGDLDLPALKLAKSDPLVTQDVASFGFGFGLEDPMIRIAHVSNKTHIPYDGIGGPLFFLDGAFVGGQSGGPVVNAGGEVVMMVQRTTPSVGIGVGAEVIKDKIGRYFEKPLPKP
jgi:S1-C subfamily serine protease